MKNFLLIQNSGNFFGRLLLCVLFFFAIVKEAQASYSYGTERVRNCDGSGSPSGLDWNPTSGGMDVEFVMSNPVCATVAITSYAAVKVAIAAMNKVCANPSSVRVTPSIFLDLADVAKCTYRAAQTRNPACIAGITAATTSLTAALAEFSVIYGIAKRAYEDTKICGSDWYGPNVAENAMTAAKYKNDIKIAIDNFIKLPPSDEKDQALSLDNKEYREWYYGGMEVEDDVTDDWGNMVEGFKDASNSISKGKAGFIVNGGTCRDVTIGPKRDNYEDYPAQKYYLKGLEAGNYNCQRYKYRAGQGDPIDGSSLTKDSPRMQQLDRAYECCKSRAREYICIQRGSQKVFCKAGSKCSIKGIVFETKYVSDYRLICAQSYSVCPYNFSIAGGTQYCEHYRDGIYRDGRWHMITPDDLAVRPDGSMPSGCSAKSEMRNDDCTLKNIANRCKNYCQYLTHCVITSNAEFNYNSGITSPYFSDACLNFVGDSQNMASYSGGILFGSERHFSAPIAQCTKETLENLFHNKAGHTECADANEYPSRDGTCESNQYIFKKGELVQQDSLFYTIQVKLKGTIKIFLVLSVMFYGMNILLGRNDIREKKDILIYLIKIGMVMYFAVGTAWQNTFFDGVYGASSVLSQMVFKIKSDTNPERQDGCQFGTITDVNGREFSSGKTYPKGKEYIAMWDTLDCKIARYLGFGPSASVANIAKLIFAGFFTGPIGLYFSLSVMFMGFFFLALTMRMLHIFLSSVIAIVLMVFVSPIVIPMILFKRTENIFKGWLTNMISFCVQPMMLFAYIAVVIMVVDSALVGSATFHGTGPFKAISCKSKCYNKDGSLVDDSAGTPPCDQSGQKIVDPMLDSVACLINIDSFGEFPGFDIIGVGIPILVNVFESNAKQKIITLLKGALIMYILFKVVDQISGITSTIIGGTGLDSGESIFGSATSMFKKVSGAANAVRKRGQRAIRKHGGSAVEGGKELTRSVQGRGSDAAKESDVGGSGNRVGGSGGASGVGSGGDSGGPG